MKILSKTRLRLRASEVLAILLLGGAWFYLSQQVNSTYMEAVDPPTPNPEGPGRLLRTIHAVMMFPVMPVLPMQWLYANLTPVATHRAVMVSLAVNSLFWGCLFVGGARLLGWMWCRNRQVRSV